jgi:hypothetical protein
VERTKRGVMALIKGLSKDDGRPQISANHTSSSDVIHTSLRNMIERQGSVSQTQVQSIQDPDPLDSKHNPRTMAYEEDARNIRFR